MAAERVPAGGGTRELRVNLDFQPGAGDGGFRVITAFLPHQLESWPGEEEEEVTFYPFPVVFDGGAEGK
jgi:hypothetical protein